MKTLSSLLVWSLIVAKAFGTDDNPQNDTGQEDAVSIAFGFDPNNLQFDTDAPVPSPVPELSISATTVANTTTTAPVSETLSSSPSLSATLVPSFSPTVAPTFSPSPAPSLSPSVATPAPTESPAPSPSPSATPSQMPSGTYGPTKLPTTMPSDSPRPSPSPSSMPSVYPSRFPSSTPTGFPSSSPSATPSLAPSASPSLMPSGIPSDAPSTVPTYSPQPSNTPSVSPTQLPSTVPSDSPTNAPSESPSDQPSLYPTGSVVPSSVPSTGEPSQVPSSVPTASPTTPVPTFITELPSNTPTGAPTFDAGTMWTVLEVTLDLHDTIGSFLQGVFEQQTKEFINSQLETDLPPPDDVEIVVTSVKMLEQTVIPARRLGAKHGRRLHDAGLRIRFNTTALVRPVELPEGVSFANIVGRPFQENFLIYIYRLSSVHPVFNDLIRNSNNPNAVEDENDRPRQQTDGRLGIGPFIGIVAATIGAVILAVIAGWYAMRKKTTRVENVRNKTLIDVYEINHCDSASTSMTPYNENPISPASTEMSAPQAKPGMMPQKSLLDDIIRNEMDISVNDSEDLGIEMDRIIYEAQAKSLAAEARQSSDPPAIFHPPSGLQPNAELHAPTNSLCYSDAEDGTPRSVELTPDASATPSTVFSGLGALGARPMNHSEKRDFEHSVLSPCSGKTERSMARSGLYDVFAPSGPLGIVVDTTRDGPVVHSMKPTSPLLGLISPGDLIVGLDDMDTRSMTAATLTRLMAKRSHQKERKITLLAVEGGI